MNDDGPCIRQLFGESGFVTSLYALTQLNTNELILIGWKENRAQHDDLDTQGVVDLAGMSAA